MLLSKKEQLEVLEEAFELIKYKKIFNTDDFYYCCLAIKRSLERRSDLDFTSNITRHIPTFTKENAIRICREAKINQPKTYPIGTSWWNLGDSTNPKVTDRSVRVNFMRAFIADFKKNM